MNQEKSKIEVIHFDYQRFFSKLLREDLVEMFKEHGDKVNYYDFMQDHHGSFGANKDSLERLLPEKDILLIHPGVLGQKIVFEYPKMFPNLEIALVIPGDFAPYKPENGIEIFSYNQKESIVEFVLSHNERKAEKNK